MRTRALAALLLLTLALSACGVVTPPTDEPPVDEPSAVEEREPLRLDALNVELVAQERDTDALLALQKAFPAALQAALAAQDVTVDAVNVTFGTSGAATATALRDGAVELAFLPAESWTEAEQGVLVALERGNADDPARSVMVLAADEPRLTDALRAALPALAPVLSDYADGGYVWDEAEAAALTAAGDTNAG